MLGFFSGRPRAPPQEWYWHIKVFTAVCLSSVCRGVGIVRVSEEALRSEKRGFSFNLRTRFPGDSPLGPPVLSGGGRYKGSLFGVLVIDFCDEISRE